ncbi:MAG: hypothetical protein WC967_07335 [Balneolaceae bacterium]
MLSTATFAQFEEPDIVKVEASEKAKFQSKFSDIKWTGQGFNYNSLDRMPAIEIRAHLQGIFGDPTQTIEDIIASGEYRDGKAVQFEYWFIIDGNIPMMILDLDGPFENGLVYVGASRYIDMMPQVKRTLTRLVTETDAKEFNDYFYSPERKQWYNVSYKGGKYSKVEIKQPPHIKF